MKIYDLSSSPSSPSYVLHLDQVTLMVDCGLDISSFLHFLPKSTLREADCFEKLISASSFQPLADFLPSFQDSSKICKNLETTTLGKFSDIYSSFHCLQQKNAFIDASHLEAILPNFSLYKQLFDFSQIDAILISNHTSFAALPFLTEYFGFKGRIFTTEPTLQLGKLLMEELCEIVQQSDQIQKHFPSNSLHWKTKDLFQHLFSSPPPPSSSLFFINSFLESLKNAPNCWRQFFTLKDLQKTLQRIETVSYGQSISIHNLLKITPFSSGYSIGSANWVLDSPSCKLSLLMPSSSGSNRHPQPLEIDALRDSDVLLLSGLSLDPLKLPEQQFVQLCAHVSSTLSNAGQIIFPIYPTGIIYDLIEYLIEYLNNHGLSKIPLLFISSVAEPSLAYSNIYAEWLCKFKQDRVYLPEPPFQHSEHVENKRLLLFSSISDPDFAPFLAPLNPPPALIFCGSPTLRCGQILYLLSSCWKDSPKNSIIFVDPEIDYQKAISPFSPFMKATHFYCPIDHKLKFQEANALIKELKPSHLILPPSASSSPFPPASLHEINSIVPCEGVKIHPIHAWLPASASSLSGGSNLGFVSIPHLSSLYEKCFLSFSLASTLHCAPIHPSTLAVSFQGYLLEKDYKKVLVEIPPSEISPMDEFKHHPKILFGSLQIHTFLHLLLESGLTSHWSLSSLSSPSTSSPSLLFPFYRILLWNEKLLPTALIEIPKDPSSLTEDPLHLPAHSHFFQPPPSCDQFIALCQIHRDPSTIHIITVGSDEHLRVLFRDILFRCLPSL